MSDESSTPPPPEEPILEKVAREAGEPRLFPPEVLRLHREGSALKARKELLRAAKAERDDALADKQRARAEDLRLWQEAIGKAPSMYTMNGVGTRLYGKAEPAEDGTYIGTLWATFIFVPIWPLASYLVFPAPEGGGWHFLSKTPMPAVATGARRGVGAVAAMLMMFAAYTAYWSGTHAEVHAFNGFDQAVHVTVGEASQVVMPRQAALFEDVPAETATFAAAWSPTEEPFESLEVDLSGHTSDVVLYNVRGRGVLEFEWVTYGEELPLEGHLLEAGPVLIEDDVDYVFTEPPDSLTSSGDGAVRSWLYAVDDGMSAEEVARQLQQIGRMDQAITVATAELELYPDDGRLLFLVALAEHGDDREAQLELFRRHMELAPDAVDLHRFYQELWTDGSPELLAEYAALLEANPDSPMYHYLAGRAQSAGSDEELAHFVEATRLDADYLPALRAIAYHGMSVDDWPMALEYFGRYAEAGPAETYEVHDARARIATRLGRPWGEIDAILSDALSAQPQALHIGRTRAHRSVETGELGVTDAANGLNDRIEQAFGPIGRETRLPNLIADLAITEGDLDRARAELDALADPSMVSTSVAQRLVLSEGSTAEDRARLESLPGWPVSGDPMDELLALGLADEEGREVLTQRMDPVLLEIAEFLDSDEVTSTDRLVELSEDLTPVMQMWVHLAAARSVDGRPGAAAARRAYLSEAYAMALPGDLPYRR